MADITTTRRYRCDLDKGVCEVTLPMPLMHQDAHADTFLVSVRRAMSPVDLRGMSVQGYLYLQATKQTLPIKGQINGNTASVTLSDLCYTVPGPFSLVIQLRNGEVRHTLLHVSGTITRTTTNEVSDPEGVLPALPDLLAQIERMQTVMENAENAANYAFSAADASIRTDKVQDLTDAQRAQARENAGAAAASDLGSLDDLLTINKHSIVSALNETILNCSGSSGSSSSTSPSINDTIISDATTWSSSKIRSEIDAAGTGDSSLAQEFAALKADYEENTIIFAESIGTVSGRVGNLDELSTVNKEDLVSAVNELADRQLSGSGAAINDETKSESTTWSSSKISRELQAQQVTTGSRDLPAAYDYWADKTPLTEQAMYVMSADTGVPYSAAITDPYLLYAVPVEAGCSYILTRYGEVSTNVYAINEQPIAALGFSASMPVDSGSAFLFDAVGSIRTNHIGSFIVPENAAWVLMMFRKASFLPVLSGNEVSLQKLTDAHLEATYPTEEAAPLTLLPEIGVRRSSILPDNPLRIEAWGDSLTNGTGAEGSDYSYAGAYPAQLANLIGQEVINLGVGGETLETILGRQGGLPMMVQPVTIPAEAQTVLIKLQSITGEAAAPLLQSASKEKGVNPVRIGDVEGTLTYDTTLGYCFQRTASGAAVTLKHPVPLVTAAMQQSSDNTILLLWLGQNNAVDAELKEDMTLFADRLTAAVRTAAAHAGTDRYLVLAAPISNPNTPTGSISAYEPLYQRMQYALGSHYINIADYLIDYGLADAGVTPTETDLTDIELRRIPTSLVNGRPHLNATGYQLVANQVYERGKLLGYWA